MLKADKAALAAALSAVSPAIRPKHTTPILQNVLITREDDHFVARGSNMDIELTSTFEATAGEAFEPFTCPIHPMVEFVKRAPDAVITVEPIMEGDRLEHINLKSGRSRLKVPVLPASDYPKLDAGNLSHSVKLDSGILSEALSAVEYATSKDVTVLYICGVFMQGCGEGLNLVSTDRYRIERRLIPAMAFDPEDPFASIPPTLVPSDTVGRILKLCGDYDDITLGFSEERMVVTAGTITLISKLIDAQFIDWSALTKLARQNSHSVQFSRAAMASAVDRVLIATPDASKGMTFAFEAGTVTLAARDFRSGEGEDEIPAEADLEITIAFNGKYLSDALAHHAGDQVELLIQRSTDNSILRPVGKPDDFTLLVPMKIQGITI